MAEKFDSNNGDFYDENLKRKGDKEDKNAESAGENEENGTTTKAVEYVKELLAEKILIDQSKLPNATRLLEQELTKAQAIGKVPLREHKYVDIYREKPIKVTIKVLVPVREHPKFNFVGKLLGPRGNSMKRLQEETMCKMAVLGRGSMKDRNKEDELRNSLDPKYSHLTDDLHVEISALGPPAEAHARVAFALAEVRKYLIPDSNDHIRLEQMREMENERDRDHPGQLGGHPGHPGAHPGHPGQAGDERGDIKSRRPGPNIPRQVAPGIIPHTPPVMRTATRAPVVTPRVMPAKTKIMSILDRARVAMEESYGYEDDNYGSNSPGYDYTPRSNYSSGYHDDYDGDYYKTSSYEPSTSRGWKQSPYPKATSSASPGSRQAEGSRYRDSPYTRPLK